MRIHIRHETRYRYADRSSYAIQSLRLTPPSFPGQDVLHWSITVPGAGPATTLRDGFGNTVTLLTITTPHTELSVTAEGAVETADRAGLVALAIDPAPVAVYLRETATTAPDAAIRAVAREAAAADPIERLHRLSALIRERVDYEIGTTHAHTTAAEALAEGKGVCQDHAHVFITAARCLGVPARYVTGYLLDSARSPEGAAAHHAWAEAYIDGLGWVGFDVANRICPNESHVRLACGLDATGAAPVRGVRRGGQSEAITVEVAVGAGGGQQ